MLAWGKSRFDVSGLELYGNTFDMVVTMLLILPLYRSCLDFRTSLPCKLAKGDFVLSVGPPMEW